MANTGIQGRAELAERGFGVIASHPAPHWNRSVWHAKGWHLTQAVGSNTSLAVDLSGTLLPKMCARQYNQAILIGIQPALGAKTHVQELDHAP